MSTVPEATIAASVVDYLLGEGYECWPEVVLPEGRADIVAVRAFPFMPERKCVHIVETKTSWSLTLLEQAVSRKQYAHYVSIAAPTRPNLYFKKLCRREGVGLIQCGVRGRGPEAEVYIDTDYGRGVAPALQRHSQHDRYFGPQRCVEALHPDQRRYSPGSTAASGYSTAWGRTMDAAVRHITAHPGCTAKELAALDFHHYATSASARQGFLLWLDKRPEVETRREGRTIRFYPKGCASVVPELPLVAPRG